MAVGGLAIQPDGKIVVAGFTDPSRATPIGAVDPTFPTLHDFAVMRYNADGGLDTSFGTGGRQAIDFGATDDFASGVAVQPDGKIVVLGTARAYTDDGRMTSNIAVARLTVTGQLDGTFGVGGRQTVDFGSAGDVATAIALQASDGKIVVAGYSEQPDTGLDFALARLSATGQLDSGFGDGGRQVLDFGRSDKASAVVVQGDGKIVVAGFTNRSDPGSNDFAVARLTATGQLDGGFGDGGRQVLDFGPSSDLATCVALQPDGRIVVAGVSYQGATQSDDFALARLTSGGRPDGSFGTAGRVTVDFGSISDYAAAVAVQKDGKIVIGGSSYQGPTDHDFAVARLTANGGTDTTFDGDGKVTTDFGGTADRASGMAIQSDGKIVLGGDLVQHFDPSFNVGLARYLASDATFGVTPLTDLDKAFQNTVPIRLQVTDPDGTNVSSPSIRVTALGLARVDGGVPGPRLPAAGVGNANPGGKFRYDADLAGYVFTLNVKGLPAGEYVFYFVVDGDPTVHELRFTLK
jgi:uncharacterized delta-60 repeat protein